MALACWAFTGALLLLFLPGDSGIVPYAVGCIVFLVASAIGMVIVQRLGLLGGLAKLVGKLVKHEAWENVTFSATEVDQVIRELYGNKLKILNAALYRLASLALHTIELWLACYLLGQPIGVYRSVFAAQPDGSLERPRLHDSPTPTAYRKAHSSSSAH